MIKYGGVISGKEEINAAIEVLKGDNWSAGQVTEQFEREAAKVQDRKYALYVNSGSSALLLAVASVADKLDIVGVPAVNFPTAPSAVHWNKKEPEYLDVDDSFNVNVGHLEEKRSYISGLIFVHLAGNPTNIKEVVGLYKKDMIIIEDNCEGFGGMVKNRKVGTFGHIAVTSTHAAHQVVTGEGGLLFTDSKLIYDKAKRLRDWGRAYGEKKIAGYYENYVFSEWGLNLRPTDIQAAIGLVQIKKLEEFSNKRFNNYNYLRERLEDLPLTLPRVDKDAHPSWYTFPMLTEKRNQLKKYLEKNEIETRTILVGNILKQPLNTPYVPTLPNADRVFSEGLWISVHPKLTKKDLDHIVKTIRRFHGKD